MSITQHYAIGTGPHPVIGKYIWDSSRKRPNVRTVTLFRLLECEMVEALSLIGELNRLTDAKRRGAHRRRSPHV